MIDSALEKLNQHPIQEIDIILNKLQKKPILKTTQLNDLSEQLNQAAKKNIKTPNLSGPNSTHEQVILDKALIGLSTLIEEYGCLQAVSHFIHIGTTLQPNHPSYRLVETQLTRLTATHTLPLQGKRKQGLTQAEETQTIERLKYRAWITLVELNDPKFTTLQHQLSQHGTQGP